MSRERPHFEIPESLVGGSLFLSTLAMVLLATEFFRGEFVLGRWAAFDRALVLLDPLLCQVLGFGVLLAALWDYLGYAGFDGHVRRKLVAGLAWGGWLFVFAVGTGVHLVVDRIFVYPFPALYLREGWLTGLVLGALHHIGALHHNSSCLSGYVLRQLWLTLATWIMLANSRDSLAQPSAHTRRVLAYLLAGELLVLVMFERVYRGTHSLFDVGVTLGLGTYVFWLFLLLGAGLVAPGLVRLERHVSELAAYYVFAGIAGLVYAVDSDAWLKLWVLALVPIILTLWRAARTRPEVGIRRI